ncbi:MAG: tetratricopeptide repeat protein [Desulfuromonadales bacterium]|nr:tetratricopeptide repeat protein [Desulfuromonadales bacterium]
MNANRHLRNSSRFFRLATILACLLTALGGTVLPDARAEISHQHDDPAVRTGDEPLGSVDFNVSCAEATRPAFDRALGLMHHMMYVEARAAFEKIVESDPECAMAYWGVATSLFQPLWGTRPSSEELNRGWSLIQKAKELGPLTGREQHLVAATEAFFREPGQAEFRTRMNRWAETMEAAYRAHPEDHDTAALYALSRLALAQMAEERASLHEEAETVLRRIYEQVPTHPGAVHYTIHATDADGRAGKSLDIVKSYGEIAPEVPHALHMPSHIYVRLGEWPEVIEWNRRSADAALRYPVQGAVSHHFPHATDYMLYAYLQQGEDDQARAVLKETLAQEKFQPSFISAYHLAAVSARYAVERRQWAEAATLQPRSPDGLPWDEAVWAESLTWFARGLGGVHTGDLDRAIEAEGKMAELRERAKTAGDQHFATYIEIDRLILAGWMARAQNRPDEAIRLIRSAGELERTVDKHPVTPGALLPPNEALGDLLTDLDRPSEALEAYRSSERIWPKRYNTLLGAARAATAAGDAKSARALYTALIGIAGESDRPGVTEAKRFLQTSRVEAEKDQQ